MSFPESETQMESHKLVVKLFADGAVGLPLDAAIPVFHRLIQTQGLPGHLLIDVADYAHVPNGPGTVLVAHEANIHLDREHGVGLLYVRKQPVAGAATFRERLAEVFRAALTAADKLQSDSDLLGGLRFRTSDIVFRINDRLVAPNTEATFAAVSRDLQAFLAELFGSDVALEHRHDPERLFEVRIKPTAKRSVSDLLARLESTATTPAR
jgi:hypothetical protein